MPLNRTRHHGRLAQLVEQLPYKEIVGSSTLSSSTMLLFLIVLHRPAMSGIHIQGLTKGKETDMSVKKTKVSPEMRAKYAPKLRPAAPSVKVNDPALVSLTRRVLEQLALPGAIPSQVIMAALLEAKSK